MNCLEFELFAVLWEWSSVLVSFDVLAGKILSLVSFARQICLPANDTQIYAGETLVNHSGEIWGMRVIK